ncbi:PTS sugar transporter subunit IIA [Salirhabdus salicampi]|uniref:PTS sugar transporter subunit IIA n=1 Tax=Salirhabdus salicampi TaxID=476102 RepID=UPI0020C1D219|nr:PTS glucose transporter subunit IIA [Salirhabdus salicampi]MCP8617347.1 PTS glucose transporter subunit IIA [Salirhabdus salicampi]
MLNKIFGKKKEQKTEEDIFSPINGTLLPLEEVPDPVFSQKMMGDGFAIEPEDGQVVSPVEGKIIQLFPTKHAVGIQTDSGLEVLVHIGLETVGMKGEGFEGHITEGDRVKVGDQLVTFDMDLVKEKAKSTITPVIITNEAAVENIERVNNDGKVSQETKVLHVKVKQQ